MAKKKDWQLIALPVPFFTGYGGRIWFWFQTRSPRKEEKKYYANHTKQKLKGN
jgi:hypothetical protein